MEGGVTDERRALVVVKRKYNNVAVTPKFLNSAMSGAASEERAKNSAQYCAILCNIVHGRVLRPKSNLTVNNSFRHRHLSSTNR